MSSRIAGGTLQAAVPFPGGAEVLISGTGCTQTGGYVTESERYIEAARIGMSDALEWGGHWESFPDPPHYQLKIDIPSKVAIGRFESGDSFGFLG